MKGVLIKEAAYKMFRAEKKYQDAIARHYRRWPLVCDRLEPEVEYVRRTELRRLRKTYNHYRTKLMLLVGVKK